MTPNRQSTRANAPLPLIETASLGIRIGDVNVCSDLNLKIQPGQCWGVLGRNGTGKTTFLRTLAGLRPPQQGDICIDGDNLHSLPRRALAQILGMLFQDNEEAFPCSALESVLIGRHPHLPPWRWESRRDRDIAMRALERVGMARQWSRTTDTLSGGEYQRVAIARLLAQAPRIVLLDEPTNHLDLGHQIDILALLSSEAQQNQGCLVTVLHDVNLALRFCDHLLLLFGDGQVLQGPVRQVATESCIGELYRQPVSLISGPHGPVVVPR